MDIKGGYNDIKVLTTSQTNSSPSRPPPLDISNSPFSPVVLSKMYDLTNAQIHAIISKMILNDELKASWDKPTNLLILHRAESSKLQSLAKQTADKPL